MFFHDGFIETFGSNHSNSGPANPEDCAERETPEPEKEVARAPQRSEAGALESGLRGLRIRSHRLAAQQREPTELSFSLVFGEPAQSSPPRALSPSRASSDTLPVDQLAGNQRVRDSTNQPSPHN